MLAKRIASLSLLSVFLLFLFSSCVKDLELAPKSAVDVGTLSANASSLQTAVNGLYRALYQHSDDALYSDWNTQQNVGYRGFPVVGDLMGTDMYCPQVGNGWFIADYRLTAHLSPTNSSNRAFVLWRYYYKLIANANQILFAIATVDDTPENKAAIEGQAYAIRATCYHRLALAYCQHVQYHPDAPGVPIYLEPTGPKTQGKSRGTVSQVYDQIKSDIDAAIKSLELANEKNANFAMLAKNDKEIIDVVRAKALKAQICLDLADYEGAVENADAVLKVYPLLKPNEVTEFPYLKVKGDGADVNGSTTYSSLGKGFCSVDLPSVVWGAKVIDKHTGLYGSFWSHFDCNQGPYAQAAPKCIMPPLYNFIQDGDLRKSWWCPQVPENAESGLPFSYAVVKYRSPNIGAGSGDVIFIRAEEILLIKAEALCRLGKDDEAKVLMNNLLENRISDPAKLDAVVEAYGFKDLSGMGELSKYPSVGSKPKNLLDAILIQRRIELWGEGSRFFHMKRLQEPMERTEKEFKSSRASAEYPVDDPKWCFVIPQDEVDANKNLYAN